MTTQITKEFIVYLTFYTGTKLPKWYIGSSYLENIKKGYNGSVTSKKYKEIYKREQLVNKTAFRTKILSYHSTRKQALSEELRLQQKHNVVANINYYNQSFASIDGFFGMDVAGETNPNSGNKWSLKQKNNLSALLKECSYYNNGNQTIRIYKNDVVPIGFTKGVLKIPSALGKKWVNDGVHEFYVKNADNTKYNLGRLNKGVKDKITINNGKIIEYINVGDRLPKNFVLGPLKYECSKCHNMFDSGNLKLHHNERCICYSLIKANISSSNLYSREDLSKIFGGLIKTTELSPLGSTKLQQTLLTKNNKTQYIGCFIKEIK